MGSAASGPADWPLDSRPTPRPSRPVNSFPGPMRRWGGGGRGETARGLGLAAMWESRSGDLLEPVRDVHADVLIGDVSGIPDAIAGGSGCFDDVPAGGPTGAELPAKFLRSIGDTL